MRRIALTICAALALLTGPVWASTTAVGARTDEVTAPSRTDGKPSPRVGSATGAPVHPQATYAAREAANPELAQFKGGNASIYIGGSTVVIVLLVVLLIVLL